MLTPSLHRLSRNHDVTVVARTPGPRDRQGNKTWVNEGDPVTIPGILTQRASKEIVLGRETVIDAWLLIVKAGTEIKASSRVVVGARQFDVDGTPDVIHLGAGVHHVEVPLRYVGDLADA